MHSTPTPSQTEGDKMKSAHLEKDHDEIQRQSKMFLGIVNAISLLVGIALVGYSAYSLGQGSGTLVTGFGIFLGLSIFLLNFLALYGICAHSEKALIVFFGIILTLTLFMSFIVICAFIFTGDVDSYVNGNWQEVQGTFGDLSRSEIDAKIKSNLLAIALIALFSLVFMISSLVFTARVLGAAKTQAKIMHITNLLTLVLGVFIIVVAAITGVVNSNQRTIAYILLFVGASIFLVSFLGYYGTKWKSHLMLGSYVVIVSILTVMLLILGIFCYADKPAAVEFVAEHWASIKNPGQNSGTDLSQYEGKVSSYLTLLGSVAIGGVIFMIFAGIVASLLVYNIRQGYYTETATPATSSHKAP